MDMDEVRYRKSFKSLSSVGTPRPASSPDGFLSGIEHSIVEEKHDGDDGDNDPTRFSMHEDEDPELRETYLQEMERTLRLQLKEQRQAMVTWWHRLKREHDLLSLFFASGYESKAASKRGLSVLSKVACPRRQQPHSHLMASLVGRSSFCSSSDA
jgi:hypothetical protein